jgi:hypothetical protein
MSIKLKTLRLIQRRLKGTQLCKDVLVVLPTEHILRGFLFERTLSKDMYYLWRVITPLYMPANPIFLDYSERISKGYLRLTREALDETAERIASIMSPGHLSYLRRVRGPKEFLKHVGWMAGNTGLNFRVDLALTHYLLGKVDQCIRILELLPLENLAAPIRVHIVPFFTELRTSPADAASRLQAWERENVERHGLAETVIGEVARKIRTERAGCMVRP